MCDSMMVMVLVTQTANWVKLIGSISVCLVSFSGSFLCFVYGCILDTINRVAVGRVHGFHPLSQVPGLLKSGNFFFELFALGTYQKEISRTRPVSLRTSLMRLFFIYLIRGRLVTPPERVSNFLLHYGRITIFRADTV